MREKEHRLRRACSTVVLASFAWAAPLHGQHEGHAGMGMTPDSMRATSAHVMAQAIPLVTRADPSGDATTRTEATLTQALVMVRAMVRGRMAIDVTLNGEGATMPGGELSTGAFGEGFVDRRHPHAYLHEVMLTGLSQAGALRLSGSLGRGFVPFGTDDPMMRPFVKYPVNHHLAQILERAMVAGAARIGVVAIEAASFGGDEPVSPSALPRASRIGDSWAVRGTIFPTSWTEVQGSYARVASPEQESGFGLDQRKRSVSARAISADGARYVLAEWARTAERDRAHEVDAFAYESALVEGSVVLGPIGLALRLEQTDRPEEERLADPFRTPRPASDLSIGGITRWRIATAHIAAPRVTAGLFSGLPFVEIARLGAEARDGQSLLTPSRLYGTTSFWMLTAGFRLRVGSAHARMGRYGAGLVAGPAIGVMR